MKYEDLDLPNYRNTSTAITINARSSDGDRVVKMPTHDLLKIVEITGLNCMLISDTGGGKTQALKDIARSHFGGNVKEGGNVNWMIGRKDSSVDELFLEWNKEEQKYVEKEGRIEALLNVVDEMNRAPPIIQNDFFDLAEGERAINGEERELGQDGYNSFLVAVNLNRINGEFEGTTEIDRALLSRARINIDLDYYEITDEDEAEIVAKGKPKLRLAPLRDISPEIMAVYKDIEEKSSQADPYVDVYLMMLSAGLRYCAEDERKKKRRNWPMDCGQCASSDKTCAKMKQMEPRTTQTIKRFLYGIDYLIGLKEGKVELDPMDLVFEAAKFTAYHGNLNMQEMLSEHKGDDQSMMNSALETIKAKVKDIKNHLEDSITLAMEEGRVVVDYLRQTVDGETYETVHDEALEKMLTEKDLSCQKFNPFEKLSEIGLGSAWVESYLKTIAARYHAND